MIDWISPATVSGMGVAVLTGVSVGAVVYGGAAFRRSTAVLAAAVIAGLVFQVVHFIEHGFQLGYWARNLEAAPWITPWAAEAADGLKWACSWAVTDCPSIGVELLHLTGNTIFLAALVGMLLLTLRMGDSVRGSKVLTAGLTLQAVHVAEHVLLTVSVLIAGRAIGLSTGFGELSGTALFTYRIWFHFVVNLAATILALLAFHSMQARGHFDGLLPRWPFASPHRQEPLRLETKD
jgi:hypothetical protein